METVIKRIASNYNVSLTDDWENNIKASDSNTEETIYVGWITKFDYLRGYGFIADLINNDEHYFHVSSIGKDLYSNKSIKNKELSKKSLLEQLEYHFYKSNDYKKCQAKIQNEQTDDMETVSTCRYGTYKICVPKYPKVPRIIEDELSDFPHLFSGQIVCFNVEDGKAANIHNPIFYTSQLLKNKDKYSNDIWNLLFHFIPRVLYSIKYKGFHDIQKEIENCKKEIRSIIQTIKQFDLKPYKDVNNYTLELEKNYSPTVKDSDPNYLSICCKTNNDADEYISSKFSWWQAITPTIEYYGEAPIEYFKDIVFDDFQKPFHRYLEKRKTIGSSERQVLVEECFKDFKEKWIKSFVEQYSSHDHLLFYLNKQKSSLINQCCFTIDTIIPNFICSSNITFKFSKSLAYYGYKMEFIIPNKLYTNGFYQLYTYDETYQGHYKGKHFINEIQFEEKDYYYTLKNVILKSMNMELKSYIEKEFDILANECLAKLD